MDELLYKLNIPTKIFHGRKIWEKAIESVNSETDIFRGNILIVTTGRSLYRLGYIDKLKSFIEELSQGNVYIFDSVSSNPKLDEISSGIRFAESNKINTVIGFGGGSAVDAAKAIAAGVLTEEDFTDFFRSGKTPQDTLPVIAIPTTSGTGSELSKAAILTDAENHVKKGIRGEKLYPYAAIVDSVFTESIPFNITMETGFDVIAHAVESYVSKSSTPVTELLSEYVIKNAAEAIKELINDLKDINARQKISMCSMLMGINLGNASTALPHRMQYPIGSHTDTSHGAGLAALYPAWLKHEKEYSESKVNEIMRLLKCDDITSFLKEMRLDISLSDLGIDSSMVIPMSEEITGNILNDPATAEKDIIKNIYYESL